jgi:hypothetical protein
MERMMPSPLQTLRETNLRLRLQLTRMLPSSGEPAIASPDAISELLTELLHAGASLRADPLPETGTDSELDREREEYRRQLQRLRELLPSIHEQLLAERERVEEQRARVQSASQWAQASRQTL